MLLVHDVDLVHHHTLSDILSNQNHSHFDRSFGVFSLFP
jgi:hypothetical protein